MNATGLFAFAILTFLPGAWLTFGLPRLDLEPRVRVLLAFVLSPVVIVAQFYAVRLLGASFAATTTILVIGNLPAAVLVYRKRSTFGGVRQLGRALPHLLVWAIPIGLLVTYWSDWEISAISAHAFLHADAVYALANGLLRVEDTQLAGLTLGYPWGGHVYQAVTSWVLGRAPVATFPLTNVVLLIAAVTLIAEVTARFGGSPRARVVTIICVLFAVNAVGYALQQYLVPDEVLRRFPVWGDDRYTPWLRKYIFWSQHPFAHALFAGILILLVGPRSQVLTVSPLLLLAAMFAGLAVMYPLLMPAALSLLAARFATDVYPRSGSARGLLSSAVRLGAIALIAGVTTAAVLMVIGDDRATGTGLNISTLRDLTLKCVESVVALAPLAVAAVYFLMVRRQATADRVGVLLLGGAASVAFFALFSIPGGRNEYKFIFTAAMCLAPLAALGADAFLSRGGPLRFGFTAVMVLLVVGTGVDGFLRGRYAGPTPLTVRINDFALRLSAEHHQEASLAAIAGRTPTNTIVVVDSSDVHVPVFAQRAMYAPPLMNAAYWGVGLRTSYLLEAYRGYGHAVVAQREAVVRRLFESGHPAHQLDALRTIEGLERPVAVLLNRSRQGRLTQTLSDSGAGEFVHRDGRWAVWLWTPTTSAPKAR